MKRASIVVVSRDKPTYLAETIASLARQTVQPDEVIVVDDASEPPLVRTSGVTHWIRNKGNPICRPRAIAGSL
jgi:GT2 family glycosyltransferase